MKHRELQILCKQRGLAANGKTAALIARLEEDKKRRKFVFIGDPNTDVNHGWIYILGYQFNLNGKGTKVDDEAASRLETHSHFKEVLDGNTSTDY